MKKNNWCLIKRNTLFLYSILSITLTSYAYDFSAIAPSGHTLYYNIIGNGVEVTNQLGRIVEGSESYLQEPTGDIIIPSSVTHNEIVYPVTAIGDGAFFTCENIASVFIPNSITSIGREAFRGITSLTTIIIPNSVSTIGYHAFCGCEGLNTVVIGNSVTSIGQWAFDGCSNLRYVTIPNSATSIGSAAFTGVKVVNYCGSASGRPWGALYVGCFYEEGDFVYQDNTKTTLIAYIGSDSSVAIPNSVSSIGNYAFYCCRSLRCVTIPNSVTSIGIRAFSNCESLSSVTIGSSVTYISSYAFNECSDLTSLTIECTNPPGLGSNVFSNVPTNIPVYVPCGKASAYQAASGWSNFTNIQENPNCHPLYYTIVDATNHYVSVSKSGSVSGFSVYTDTWPNLEIPSTVTYNNQQYTVTTIAAKAFYDCRDLTSITLPATITESNQNAFNGCSQLTAVYYEGTLSQWCDITFNSYYSNPVFVAHNLYIDNTLLTDLTIPDGKTIIKGRTFTGANCITSLSMPNSVTQIGENAFASCDNLSSVSFSNELTTIERYAFDNCSSLTQIDIPNSVTTIGYGAFRYCSGLTNATIGNSATTIGNLATTIGDYAFEECSGLTSITIGNSVTSIGKYVFDNCSSLTSVTIGNSVTSIGDDAFQRCNNITTVNFTGTIAEWCGISFGSALSNPTWYTYTQSFNGTPMGTTLTIPNSVTSIGKYAFYNCRDLTSVTIGNSVTSIGNYAFYYCSGLTSITIGKSVTDIAEFAFGYCFGLRTVYNLSNLTITPGASNGYVACWSYRVVNCTEHSGSGDNIIYKIPNTFTIVDNDASTSSTEIPRSTIPTNFIYYDNCAKDGGSWKAKNIVLTDGQDAFEAPETFTAEKATYHRNFANGNRSTLYLPFTAAVPEGFEVYDFAGFNSNALSFATHTGDIAAYTPYLVGYDLRKDDSNTCTITQTNATFPKSEEASYHPVTRGNMTFSGVLERTEMTNRNSYGYSNGFFVQSGGHAHVNPFRCYFTYNPPAGSTQSLSPTLNVEFGDDPIGIDEVEIPEQQVRYSNDVYDLTGRLVRRNAESLDGLPRGIYIWRGKKVVAFK